MTNEQGRQPALRPANIYDMREECRKEVDMRYRVYGDRVRHGDMNRLTADRRIATMEAVVDLLDTLIADWEKHDGIRR